MIELERTFLAKYLPEDLEKHERIEIEDIYIPRDVEHPILRIRRIGDKFEITKKSLTEENDPSKQEEQTIVLSYNEYLALSKLDGKTSHKIRYFYPYNGYVLHIDVYQGCLKGLVVIDVEFENEKEKAAFEMPEFCLADVTNEKFMAGGMLCGKCYEDIEPMLKRFGYKRLGL
ncbi:MAG: hypothetical protein J7K68_02605 [Candidatus Diapherotrites archaeon]|nr:hypothetical protein [Candidatus Diapherotrites archaeon]